MSISVTPVNVNDKPRVDRAGYLAELLAHRLTLPADLANGQWLGALRDLAAAALASAALPTTRDEEWRFTDLEPLLRTQFTPAIASGDITLNALEDYLLPDTVRLVFVNGVFAPALSTTTALPDGVFVGSLAQALDAGAEVVQPYLTQLPGQDELFTTLNTASFTDAAVVAVPKQVESPTRVHLLWVTTASYVAVYPRVLLSAAAHSRISVIEDYVGFGDAPYFANAVTEIAIAENAEVIHTRVQRDGAFAVHIGKTAVTQARDSRYTCNAISLGAELTRHHLDIYQQGEQTQTTLNGLTLIRDRQVSDTHSAIALTAPYGTTRQLHKCIVGDRAHAIFNGKVFVPQAAQQTDAGQLHRTLLLSPKARVDTKPQLEIVADNVKCTHGAAVGQMSADELFYLQSRGISLNDARTLLIYAFAYEILEHIAIDSLRNALVRWVMTSSSPSTNIA